MFARRCGAEIMLNWVAKSNHILDILNALFNKELGAVFQFRKSLRTTTCVVSPHVDLRRASSGRSVGFQKLQSSSHPSVMAKIRSSVFIGQQGRNGGPLLSTRCNVSVATVQVPTLSSQ